MNPFDDARDDARRARARLEATEADLTKLQNQLDEARSLQDDLEEELALARESATEARVDASTSQAVAQRSRLALEAMRQEAEAAFHEAATARDDAAVTRWLPLLRDLGLADAAAADALLEHLRARLRAALGGEKV